MEGLSPKYENLVAEEKNLRFPKILHFFSVLAESKKSLIYCLAGGKHFAKEISVQISFDENSSWRLKVPCFRGELR